MLTRRFGCPPWATTFDSLLRLPPSLPLMSPFGLPSAGYPASARWHVFRFQVSGFRFQVFLPLPPIKTQNKTLYQWFLNC